MHGRRLRFFFCGKDNKPLLVRPDGKIVEFKMNRRVPYFDDECLPKEIPEYWLECFRTTIEKFHDRIDPDRYAMSASDVEAKEGHILNQRSCNQGRRMMNLVKFHLQNLLRRKKPDFMATKQKSNCERKQSQSSVCSHIGRRTHAYCDVCNRSKMLKHCARKTDQDMFRRKHLGITLSLILC